MVGTMTYGYLIKRKYNVKFSSSVTSAIYQCWAAMCGQGRYGPFPWSQSPFGQMLLKASVEISGVRWGVRSPCRREMRRRRKTGEGWPLLTCWRCSWRWSSPREPGQGPHPAHPGGQSAVGCGPGAATAAGSRHSACLRDTGISSTLHPGAPEASP